LEYESRKSADLVIDASLLGSRFGDDELAAFGPVAGQIVAADFSGTAITDGSSAELVSMKRLRSLRLMRTKISDVTVKALTPLSQLESLNLFDTPVTADALTSISQLAKLRHLYLHGTKVPPDAILPEPLKNKVIF
jgi:hypothetical protein